MDEKRIIGSLMTMNMRGLKNKIYNVDGIDFCRFVKKYGVLACGAQDLNMREQEKQKIVQHMKFTIPETMSDNIVTMQEGLKGKTDIKHDGCGLIVGNELAMFASSVPEIVDPRGWGRISGRVILGKKDEYMKTNLAIISVYVPSPDSSDSGSQWNM